MLDKVNYLSPRKREVISTCFELDGKSKQNESELAARMDITAAGVSAIKMKALRDLRKKINREEIRMHF
ncbi:MAG: sigma factor-like helix-turn-helix DNA-binding protein [Nanoarchaeota archaeon]